MLAKLYSTRGWEPEPWVVLQSAKIETSLELKSVKPLLEPLKLAFIDAIIREPERDDLRLIFSDWLKENGEEHWGRYLELAVLHNLNRHTTKIPEEISWLATNYWWNEWLGIVGEGWLLRLWPHYRFAGIRGFVGWCSCDTILLWERKAIEIVRRVPLLELEVLEAKRWVRIFGKRPMPAWGFHTSIMPSYLRESPAMRIMYVSEKTAEQAIAWELVRLARREAFKD